MKSITPRNHRWAVAALFFFYGLCFASWASRIPSIQQNLGLSESALGGVLFALPVGLFISLPLSGWLIAKIGSRKVIILSGLLYALLLLGIGFSSDIIQLVVSLFFFGFCGNMLNISANTQAVGVEDLYQRPIMASFHGMWSLAGLSGAAIGTFMIASGVLPRYHYVYISAFSFITLLTCHRYLLNQDLNQDEDRPIFSMPDKSILSLGVIAFCSMMCEGAMFDWSGVYFKKVVEVEKSWIGAGYTAFMFTMAGTRFFADALTHRLGLKRVLQVSGSFTALGLLVAVLFPALPTAIVGFLLVGMGVSSVVPLVYSAVGKNKKLSPGVALAAVSTLGFFGLLLGPSDNRIDCRSYFTSLIFCSSCCHGLKCYFFRHKNTITNRAGGERGRS